MEFAYLIGSVQETWLKFREGVAVGTFLLGFKRGVPHLLFQVQMR